MIPQPVHKDPRWWLRCEEVAPPRPLSDTDLCGICGHARSLHSHGKLGEVGECSARSKSLIGDPDPCDCTNKGNGLIFRSAATLVQVTAGG